MSSQLTAPGHPAVVLRPRGEAQTEQETPGHGRPPGVAIERVTDPALWPVLDRLLREYVPWVMEQLSSVHGMRFENHDEHAAMHHAAFAEDAKRLYADSGRLLLARLHGQPVGMAALRPVNDLEADVKRLYVRTAARGQGIGHALMQRLLADARSEGFSRLRLETLSFMKDAQALYADLGFSDAPMGIGTPVPTVQGMNIGRILALELQPLPGVGPSR